MRITDNLIHSSFLKNFNSVKEEINKIQNQITTGSKINKPSDSPLGASRVLKFNEQLSNINVYLENINHSSAFINNSISSVEGISSIVQKMQVDFTSIANAVNNGSMSSYGDKLENYLTSIIDFANADYDGQYLFSGTDHTTKPYGFSNSGNKVITNLPDVSGEKKIKISKSIEQKINISGEDLFGSVIKQSGNFDLNSAIGTTTTRQTEIYDIDGNQYSFNINYTKTSANHYNLNYSITDSTSQIVFEDTKEVVFNSASGSIQTIGGNAPAKLKIEVQSKNLDLVFDMTTMTESSKQTASNLFINNRADVLNLILAIKNGLKNGSKPNDNQIKVINDFNKHVLNKLSELGVVSNKLSNTAELLQNEELEIQKLLSKEKDVDVAKAVLDLQNHQNVLDITYKMSSRILPRSLVDFL